MAEESGSPNTVVQLEMIKPWGSPVIHFVLKKYQDFSAQPQFVSFQPSLYPGKHEPTDSRDVGEYKT